MGNKLGRANKDTELVHKSLFTTANAQITVHVGSLKGSRSNEFAERKVESGNVLTVGFQVGRVTGHVQDDGLQGNFGLEGQFRLDGSLVDQDELALADMERIDVELRNLGGQVVQQFLQLFRRLIFDRVVCNAFNGWQVCV